MGQVVGKVFFKAKMARRRFLSRSSWRRCTCRSVQIDATFRFRDEETSFARSRATFASPLSIGHFQSAEQMFNRLSGERRRCSLACIAIYRVAVGFTSRRISKGPRSAFHSFQALLLYILPRSDYAQWPHVNPQGFIFN